MLIDYLTSEEVRDLSGTSMFDEREVSIRPANQFPPIPAGCPEPIRTHIIEARARLVGIDLEERARKAELRDRLDISKTVSAAA